MHNRTRSETLDFWPQCSALPQARDFPEEMCAMVTKYRLQNEDVLLDPSSGSYNPQILDLERMSVRNEWLLLPYSKPLTEREPSVPQCQPEYM